MAIVDFSYLHTENIHDKSVFSFLGGNIFMGGGD